MSTSEKRQVHRIRFPSNKRNTLTVETLTRERYRRQPTDLATITVFLGLSFFVTVNPDTPVPRARRIVYPKFPSRNALSFTKPARACSIFATTGSGAAVADTCCASHFANTSSPSVSPTDFRSAISFLTCPLVSFLSSTPTAAIRVVSSQGLTYPRQ